jgi:hypothetical protein
MFGAARRRGSLDIPAAVPACLDVTDLSFDQIGGAAITALILTAERRHEGGPAWACGRPGLVAVVSRKSLVLHRTTGA